MKIPNQSLGVVRTAFTTPVRAKVVPAFKIGLRGPGLGGGNIKQGCDILGWIKCMDRCDYDWCEFLCDTLYSCPVQVHGNGNMLRI